MKLVIGVGAQKAGTTWLADYLEGHGEVLMSPIKELHFFDEKHKRKEFAVRTKRYEGLRRQICSTEPEQYFSDAAKRQRVADVAETLNFDADTRRYAEFFRRRLGNRKVACEITPSYAMLDAEAFRDMKSAAEEVKIIFLLRNPVDRFWSAVRMAEDRGTFSGEADYLPALERPAFTLRGDYRRTVTELSKVFAPEDVHVAFYEELFSEAAIRRICEFMGIEPRKADFNKEVNKTKLSKKITPAVRAAVYRKFSDVYKWAHEEFDGAIPDSWRKDVAEFG